MASLEEYARAIGVMIAAAELQGFKVQVFQAAGGKWYLDVVAEGPDMPYDFAQAWDFGEGRVHIREQSE